MINLEKKTRMNEGVVFQHDASFNALEWSVELKAFDAHTRLAESEKNGSFDIWSVVYDNNGFFVSLMSIKAYDVENDDDDDDVNDGY